MTCFGLELLSLTAILVALLLRFLEARLQLRELLAETVQLVARVLHVEQWAQLLEQAPPTPFAQLHVSPHVALNALHSRVLQLLK